MRVRGGLHMNIKEAMESYFTRLCNLYKKTFGTLPSVSWDSHQSQELFIGKPDEDGEIQWKPMEAIPINLNGLCKELQVFYSSYYYWELKGEYQGKLYDFPPVPSFSSAETVASAAINDGNYYFPNQKTILLASCSFKGNDDLLLFYRQESGELFIYDVDKRFVFSLDFSLVELISSMKAVI